MVATFWFCYKVELKRSKFPEILPDCYVCGLERSKIDP